MTTSHEHTIEYLLGRVREVARPSSDAKLRRRILDALDAGASEVKVAEAAGISRPTVRAWTRSRWVVDWRGEEIVIEDRRFDAMGVAQMLTDLPVKMAGFDHKLADDLEVGESTVLTVDISTHLGQPRRSLHYKVTRER